MDYQDVKAKIDGVPCSLILRGAQNGEYVLKFRRPAVTLERIEAIHWALDHGQAGDVLVLCGKGHETYQEVNHEKRRLDEREIVAEHLR